MFVREINDTNEKQKIARLILESLTDWFGVPESRESYIRESADRFFAAAFDKEQPVGFICLKETGKDTAEIAVMGVLKEYHRKGTGTALFRKAKEIAVASGYSFLQVKTVQMGKYEDYDRTNRFYRALGFMEFEVFPMLWDEHNPCQVYVMSLNKE
ncbi:MAG: GNAT family N-acetyltransferase [Clostridia bacterium]|nr:GNAT family N-acetyltransferase [Clostridia bacterium]